MRAALLLPASMATVLESGRADRDRDPMAAVSQLARFDPIAPPRMPMPRWRTRRCAHSFQRLLGCDPPPRSHLTAPTSPLPSTLLTICWPLTAEVGCPLRSQDGPNEANSLLGFGAEPEAGTRVLSSGYWVGGERARVRGFERARPGENRAA